MVELMLATGAFAILSLFVAAGMFILAAVFIAQAAHELQEEVSRQ